MYFENDKKDFICSDLECCCVNCNFLTTRSKKLIYKTIGHDQVGMPKRDFQGFKCIDNNVTTNERKEISTALLSLHSVIFSYMTSLDMPELRCYRSIWSISLNSDFDKKTATLPQNTQNSETLKKCRKDCEFFIPYRHGCTADGAIEIEKRKYEHQQNIINQTQTEDSLELTRKSNKRTIVILSINIIISVIAIIMSIWAINTDKEGDINNTLQAILKHYKTSNPVIPKHGHKQAATVPENINTDIKKSKQSLKKSTGTPTTIPTSLPVK